MKRLFPQNINSRLLQVMGSRCRCRRDDGFTLLELIIVIIFAAILAAVAVPAYLNQAGKARQSELLLTLGAMNRAQQGYHFRTGSFASTIAILTDEMGQISSKYYSFPDPLPTEVDATKVKNRAVALNPNADLVKNYALGVYFTSGLFGSTICQGLSVGDTVNVGDIQSDPCDNNGVKLY